MLEQHPFQSLTGRLQTQDALAVGVLYFRFNPSQVGYKHCKNSGKRYAAFGFNPSQVGYKRLDADAARGAKPGFNPSQVGYKPLGFMVARNRPPVSIPHR